MKNAAFPAVCIDPELRDAAEQSLRDGETIASFVEQSIRDSIARRHQRDLGARARASPDNPRRTDRYASSDAVLERLEQMLAAAKAGV